MNTEHWKNATDAWITVIITIVVIVIMSCNLSTPTPVPTPEPTATATITPTPVVIVVTATPAPIDLNKDVITAPPSYWMDLEIFEQFPDAEIWPVIGVGKNTYLYRLFRDDDGNYMAVFEQVGEKWELVDVIEMSPTPAPEPSKYMKDT